MKPSKGILSTAGSFLLEWLKQATLAGSWPFRFAKIVLFLLALAIGINGDDVITVSHPPEKGQDMVAISMSWHPQIGWVLAGVIVLIVTGIALGMTLVRFRSLDIGDNLEWSVGTINGVGWIHFRLPICNTGFFPIKAPVWFDEMANATAIQTWLNVELTWMHHGGLPECPSMSRGDPYKVDVFSVTPVPSTGEVELHAQGMRGTILTFAKLSIPLKGKIWIRLRISGYKDDLWYSVEANDYSLPYCDVKPEAPPFLPPKRTLSSRLRAIRRWSRQWLASGKLELMIQEGIRAGIEAACRTARQPHKPPSKPSQDKPT